MYNVLKKQVFLIFIMVSILTVFGSVAFAGEIETVTVNEKIMAEIDKTNDYIYKEIEKTKEIANMEVLKTTKKIQHEQSKLDKLNEIQDDRNRKIEQNKIYEKIQRLERELDKTIDILCERLIEKTEKKVEELIKKANKYNIEIVKEYIEVTIYNKTILVDPCCAH
jgi:TolA-binding protein